MKFQSFRVAGLWAGALALIQTACVTSVSLRDSMVPSPPSLMVATKSPRTAYLVLDAARVPSRMAVAVDGQHRGGEVTELDVFVSRDLQALLANYFEEVKVVPSAQVLPDPHGVVIEVKVERIEIRTVGPGAGYATIKWGAGLRPVEHKEYLYAFASESAGTPGTEVKIVLRSAFETALTQFLQGYTDKEIHQKILAADADADVPGPEASGPTRL